MQQFNSNQTCTNQIECGTHISRKGLSRGPPGMQLWGSAKNTRSSLRQSKRHPFRDVIVSRNVISGTRPSKRRAFRDFVVETACLWKRARFKTRDVRDVQLWGSAKNTRSSLHRERYSSRLENNCFAVMRSTSKEGSYSRLADFCITQL